MSQNPNTTNITPPTGGTPVSAPVPAPPQFLPKGTPKEQASAITRDIANTLGPSDNPIADAYGAARPQPFKPEGSSGGVMQQVHNKLSPLLAYLENEKNQEVQALLAEFGGDKMGVIKQALDLCGVNSHTSFSNIMRDLVENDTHAAKFINSDAPVQDKRAAVNAYRQLQIKSLQSEIRAQAQEWISEGFDLQSVALLLNGKGATKVVSSQGLPIIQYAGLNIARKLRDSLIAIPDTTKRVSTALSYLRQYGVSKPQLKAVVNSSDKQLQEAVENFDQTTDLTNEYNQEQVGLNAPQSDTATLINEFVKIVGRAKFLEMAKTAKSLVPGRVSVLNSGKGMTMARYWNGTPIGPGDTDYNQPTSKNEILSEVGLDSRNFPMYRSSKKKLVKRVGVSTAIAVGVLGVGVGVAGASGTTVASHSSTSAHDSSTSTTPSAQCVMGAGGTVTALSSTSITVSDPSGTSNTYTIDSSTTVTKDRAASTVSALAVGEQVHIRPTAQGSTTAASIDIVPPSVMGKVTAISGDTITITGPNSTTDTVIVSSATTYSSKGTSATLANITVGSSIFAEGTFATGSTTTLDATSVGIGVGPGHGPGPDGPGGPGGPGHDAPTGSSASLKHAK